MVIQDDEGMKTMDADDTGWRQHENKHITQELLTPGSDIASVPVAMGWKVLKTESTWIEWPEPRRLWLRPTIFCKT